MGFNSLSLSFTLIFILVFILLNSLLLNLLFLISVFLNLNSLPITQLWQLLDILVLCCVKAIIIVSALPFRMREGHA